MTVLAAGAAIVDLPVAGMWSIAAIVLDADGLAVAAPPVVTVTSPAGVVTTPSVDVVTTGVYRVDQVVATPGRWTARAVAAGYGVVDFVAQVSGPTTGPDMPDLDDCKTYLGIDLDDTSRDDDVESALTAESGAQRDVCRVPAVYPAALREALLRRVARNLALRMLPLAVLRGDGEAGDTILPGNDPEVRRFERPHRRMKVG